MKTALIVHGRSILADNSRRRRRRRRHPRHLSPMRTREIVVAYWPTLRQASRHVEGKLSLRVCQLISLHAKVRERKKRTRGVRD